MKRNCFFAIFAVLMLTNSSNLLAVDVTFTFGASDSNLSTIVKTQSGITLTLSNPNTRSTFFADSNGLYVGLPDGVFFPGTDSLTSFDLQVTGGSVTLTSYKINYYRDASSATFSMSGGTGTSTGNQLAPIGTYNANGNWTLAPGETGTLTATGFGSSPNLSVIKSLTFAATPVPEPSTYALGAMAAMTLGYIARKRQSK